MGSFKLKLVGYFVLLALVPLAAAFWGFHAVVSRSATDRVDARLEAGLRAALTAYQDEVPAAGHRAGDPSYAPQRAATVSVNGHLVGEVLVSVPLDAPLLARLQRRAGLADEDRLVLLDHGRIAIGPPELKGAVLPGALGRAAVRKVGDERYRILATTPLPAPASTALAVLSPQENIDRVSSAGTRRLGLALLAILVLIALVAYLLSRSVVRTLGQFVGGVKAIASGRLHERVPVRGRDEFAELGTAFNEMAEQLELRLTELEAERRRLRAATLRFGEVLAATHDSGHLRRVLVETAVEATGAAGGELLGPGARVVVGDPSERAERIEQPLSTRDDVFGTLILVGDDFDRDARELAALLARQGVVALENARLHEIVELQAVRDELTGLSNRRRAQQVFHDELHRAERLGSPLALVLADLDDFKAINDEHGHPIGDLVLREFAATVLATVREIDQAARWGGEEFAVFLPGADAEGAAVVAERLREAFESRTILTPDGEQLSVTASFGVAAYPDEAGEEQLVAAADAALYAAKRSGKNRVLTAGALVGRP